MAPRALGKAAIAFGMVSIPVKMYSAAESAGSISFKMLGPQGEPLKQQYISSKSGEPVEYKDRIKGYEFSKGKFVTFSKDELKAIEAASSHEVEIEEFVPADQVDRRYQDKVYFLAPDLGGNRAYRLLAQSLDDTGMMAIGRYAARGKEHLVAIRPYEGGLAMEQLHYHQDLRDFAELEIEDGEVKPAELALAKKIVAQGASKAFKPEKYTDKVRQQVENLIERKIAGEDITVVAEEESDAKIVDLMGALKASLAAAEPKPAKRASAAKKTTRKKKSA